MSKAKVKSHAISPPYLAAAFVCERVLVENDKVPSYMRVVDRLTLPRPVEGIPRGAVVVLNVTLVISFRADAFKGKLPLRIERIGPSGEKVTFIEHDLEFAGPLPESGNTLGIHMHMQWDGEGLYCLDVFLGGLLRSRIPLKIELAKESPTEAMQGKVPKKPTRKVKI